MNGFKTIYATIRIDYECKDNTADDADNVAAMACERANMLNHTFESGIRLDNVELCQIND